MLVCGEGRLNAFHILGETHIPALVVDVIDEDAFIMSLVENIARRGYSEEIIIRKTSLSPKYVKDIVLLFDLEEERLIEGVQRGTIPLTTALKSSAPMKTPSRATARPTWAAYCKRRMKTASSRGVRSSKPSA